MWGRNSGSWVLPSIIPVRHPTRKGGKSKRKKNNDIKESYMGKQKNPRYRQREQQTKVYMYI